MRDDCKSQMDIIKAECYKLSQMLGWSRLEIKYTKQKKFLDDGILDVYNIYHHFSS